MNGFIGLGILYGALSNSAHSRSEAFHRKLASDHQRAEAKWETFRSNLDAHLATRDRTVSVLDKEAPKRRQRAAFKLPAFELRFVVGGTPKPKRTSNFCPLLIITALVVAYHIFDGSFR